MHSKELYSNAKVTKKPKNQRKSSKDLIKKIIPRSTSGSYDLNPFMDESNHVQNNHTPPQQNHRHHHHHHHHQQQQEQHQQHKQQRNQASRPDNETFSSDAITNTTTNTSNLSSNLDYERAHNILKNSYASSSAATSTAAASSAHIEFPKKRSCMGLPILCLAYFAAIYTLVMIFCFRCCCHF